MRPVRFHFLNLSIVDPQRFDVERAERERVERMERERNERERMERERNERERLERERNERERMERERMERERMERERMERERVEQEQAERGRVERDRVEREQEFLFRRLMPVKTGYHRKFRCMDGTRQSLLNHIVDWVANNLGQENVQRTNTYWFYSSPGIGKTSLAHSICARLHE